MKIIVARYNEDITWTKLFSSNVLIYNKGQRLDEPNVINLNNVGREGHTYFHHIYNNYDNLDDYLVFVQGKPFDHSPNIIKSLLNFQKQINKNHKNLNQNQNQIGFRYLSEKIIKANLFYCPHHPGLPLEKTFKELFPEIVLNENNIANHKFCFGSGAQFIVSKSRIKQRPREFYLKIVQMLEKEPNPIEGFVIERFHALIFSANEEECLSPLY